MSRDEQVRQVRELEVKQYTNNPNYAQMERIRATIQRVHAATDYDNPADVQLRSAVVRMLNTRHQALYRKGADADVRQTA